jgi:DNA-binding CsgD family transcriptional regulator
MLERINSVIILGMVNMGKHMTAVSLDDQPVFQLLDWISFKPTPEDLARGIATDYLREHGATGVRFALLADDDSLHHIASYGFKDFSAGKIESADQWRSRDDKVRSVVFNDHFIGWTPDRTMIGASIRERGVSKGSFVVKFDAPVEDHVEVLDLVTKLVRVVGFYLTQAFPLASASRNYYSPTREVSRGDFTSRQLQILQGMVEGKTNHELATDLGYSVSTIRHETMRIFQILGVSDRREAARAALDRTIL